MSQTLHEKMMKLHSGDMGSNPKRELKAYTVALKSKKKIAENTMAFTFEKPQGMQFLAGQHVRMTLIDPSETDSEGNSRFFSLASTTSEPNLMIAVRMRDTAFKRTLAKLPIDSKVLIQIMVHSHEGAITLHADNKRPAVFLIGGIGIVPAYAIIKDWAKRKLKHDITLIYSNRRPEDAPFLAELQNLAKQNPKLTFIATMTETERSTKKWSGETGRVDGAMLEKYIPDITRPVYYLAGLSEMVKAMQNLLTGFDLAKDNIRSEEWGNFTMAHGNQANRPIKVFIATIVLAVLAFLALHIFAVASFTSLKGPLLYLLSAIGITILLFKIKVISAILRQKKEH